jgi:hypothetical protein
METLMAYVNKHNKYNIVLLQSTPQTYVNALKKQNITWPTQYNDMFPYSDNQDEFWSGFFTSRPTTKKLVKDGSAHLHSSSKLYAQKIIN